MYRYYVHIVTIHMQSPVYSIPASSDMDPRSYMFKLPRGWCIHTFEARANTLLGISQHLAHNSHRCYGYTIVIRKRFEELAVVDLSTMIFKDFEHGVEQKIVATNNIVTIRAGPPH